MKKSRWFIFLIGIFGMSLLYSLFAFNFQEEMFYEIKSDDFYGRERLLFTYDLPYKETLFIKIKTNQEIPIKGIIFNGVALKYPPPNLKGVIGTYSIFVPGDAVSTGTHDLLVYFTKPPALKRALLLRKEGWKITTRIYNYRKILSGNLTALFADNHIFNNEDMVSKFLKSFVIFLFMFFLLRWFLNKLSVALVKLFDKYLPLFLLPLDILLAVSYFILLKFNYRIAVVENSVLNYFMLLLIIEFALTTGIIIVIKFFKINSQYKREAHKLTEIIENNKLSPELNKAFIKLLPLLKKGDFSDKCIAVFIFLLAVCTLFFILKAEALAKQTGNLAYCILFAGVIIKFSKMFKDKKQSG